MSFNALQFYKDYHVRYATAGNKHCQAGWIQIHCPFCAGSKGYHLGFHIATGAYNCWRCGTKGQTAVVMKLLGCGRREALDVIRKYKGRVKSGRDGDSGRDESGESSVRVSKRREAPWPTGTAELTERHENYLRKRNFDPSDLRRIWGLRGTGTIGAYKFRIIIPITYKGKRVSYQGRDITGKSELKYKACPKAFEVMEHQTILYGLDQCESNSCVVVEGVVDVWRLGPGAVCCFGTAFTTEQVNLLAKRFTRVFVLFDGGEPTAAKQAEKLASLLSGRGLEVEILELEEGDPGEMKQRDADRLMKELGFKE